MRIIAHGGRNASSSHRHCRRGARASDRRKHGRAADGPRDRQADFAAEDLLPSGQNKEQAAQPQAWHPTWKTHVAAMHQRPWHLAAVATAATTRADVWPAAEPIATARLAAAETERLGPANTAESAPNELVVGGQAIQVVSPDDANEIDLAADTPEVPPSKRPRSDLTEWLPAAKTSAEPAVTVRAHDADPASTSACAQLLAAGGGAMAAASVAWFLIGSAPQRGYD